MCITAPVDHCTVTALFFTAAVDHCTVTALFFTAAVQYSRIEYITVQYNTLTVL